MLPCCMRYMTVYSGIRLGTASVDHNRSIGNLFGQLYIMHVTLGCHQKDDIRHSLCPTSHLAWAYQPTNGIGGIMK